MSDTHIEFFPLTPSPDCGEDLVLLMGDIGIGEASIRWAAETFKKQVIFFPGNHEPYGEGEILDTMKRLDEAANIHGMVSFTHPGSCLKTETHMICGGTLWTDFCLFGGSRQEAMMHAAAYGMNDYQQIVHEKARMRPETTLKLHKAFMDGIRTNVTKAKEEGLNVVVCTHHAPSRKSCHPKYGSNNPLNAAYASELDGFILDNPHITHWFHGHTHHSMDYQIGNCRVLSNPRGYASSRRTENADFNPDLVIEV